jgi:hypothetical protein
VLGTLGYPDLAVCLLISMVGAMRGETADSIDRQLMVGRIEVRRAIQFIRRTIYLS